MNSDLVVIAQAVTDSINGHAFPPGTPAFVPALKFSPVIDLAKMGDDTHVSVIPRSHTPAAGTRGDPIVDLAVDVGVQRRVDPDDNAKCEEMLALVQAIILWLYRGNLPGLPQLRPLSITNEPAVAADHLAHFNVFTSVITVTYRVTLQ